MIQLSLPTRVRPPSWTVPVLKLQNSRMVLPSPISSRVGSAAYFLSWGSEPMEQNWKIRLLRPMRVCPSTTTWGPMRVPSPISTCSPITE